MAWICDKNGNHRCEIKQLSYNGTFMEVSSITVTVESPAPIAFAIGDYIDWDYDGLRYTLDTAAGVEKQARRDSVGNAFVYENLVFLSPLNATDRVEFLDVVLGNTNDFHTNTEFSFYGTAWDYAKRLEANLCRLYGSGSWKVRIWTGGTCYDTSPATDLDTGAWENKLVDVSGIKCLAGFQQIYDLWGCAYVFSVVSGVNYVDFYDDFEQYAKAWQVGGVDKIFAYGKGNGLYKIRHAPDADHVLVTRLRAYGSGENIPANYYLNSSAYHVDGNESSELAISHLMLPASQWTKNGVKHPSNAYIEQNVDLYGVWEGVMIWDGSDSDLGDIRPTIYGLTIQDLLDLMTAGTSYRPDASKWPDTSQRIDKIITGAAPTDNGAVAEAGYDYTVVESTGSTSSGALDTKKVSSDVDFSDIVMNTTPSVSHLADYRIVVTSANDKVVSFDVPSSVASSIDSVTATLTPFVGGVRIEDATFPCSVAEEDISVTVGEVLYTKRYYIRLLDSAGSPIVFSTMYTGAVTFLLRAHINYASGSTVGQIDVVRNEYVVAFNLLRGNKAIDKFFSVTIPQVGFDVAAAVSKGAKLCMRSGANQPREFQIVSVRYLDSSDTWYLRCKRTVDQSISTYFPNCDYVIATGDEYYLVGIIMPSLYVEIAAQRLLEAATAWLAEHSKPRMLSAVDVDNKIMAAEGIVLKEGMSLPLSDTDLNITPQNQESRIIDNIRIEEGTDAVRTFTITLRDKKEKSSLDAAIRGATSQYATSADVNNAIGAIEDHDHGSLSGRDMPNQHPISAISGLEAMLFFEEDGNGNVKLKDEYGGLWAKGFMSAGGVSSGGGGGGGGTTVSWGESTTQYTELSVGDTSVATNTRKLSLDGHHHTSSDIDDFTAAVQAIIGSSTSYEEFFASLQSQIDAVSARNSFDELLASAISSDILTAQSIYGAVLEVTVGASIGGAASVGGQLSAGSIKLAAGTPVLSWNSTNSAWHLTGNLIVDGWISAGGVGSGGGGGGGGTAVSWLTEIQTDSADTIGLQVGSIPHFFYTKQGADAAFAPISHTHTTSDITDFSTAVAALIAGSDLATTVSTLNTTVSGHTTSINTLTAKFDANGKLLFANLPTLYWADVQVSNQSNSQTQPTFWGVTVRHYLNVENLGISTTSLSIGGLDVENAITALQGKFDSTTGKLLYANLPDLYWANVRISDTSSTETVPHVGGLNTRGIDFVKGTQRTMKSFIEVNDTNSVFDLEDANAAYLLQFGDSNGLRINSETYGVHINDAYNNGVLINTPKLLLSTQLTFTAEQSDSGATLTKGLEYNTTYHAWYLHSNLIVDGFISAGGVGSGGGGGSSASWETTIATDSDNAIGIKIGNTTHYFYTNKWGADLDTRVQSLEAGSALTITTTGSGNAVTDVSKSGTVITVTKGATFLTAASLDGAEAALASLQSQVDSVSARNSYDELSATVFNADIVTATTAYIESIVGSLTGNAATATKLAASKTINGTAFDGSANIVTSSWGTERTITVKDNDGTNYRQNPNIDGSANFDLVLPSSLKVANLTATGTITGELSGNASTATKLKTARKINDSSFDGSADITTAKWGTARTITVKDYTSTNSKANSSIDGSADFNLLLPESLKVKNLAATGALSVGGVATMSSTLDVTGAVTLSSSLTVAGNSTLQGTLAVNGNTTLGDNAVSDTTTINGLLTVFRGASYRESLLTLSDGFHTVTLGLDSSGYLKISGSMYATGFISAGGVSSGGGVRHGDDSPNSTGLVPNYQGEIYICEGDDSAWVAIYAAAYEWKRITS